MELLRIVAAKSPSKKKWTAFFKNKETGKIKRTSFGAKGMDDYTLTQDKAQRDRYRKRHIKDLDTDDFTRAGYLSYWILWGPYTSMDDNIAYYKRKFNL